MIWLEKIFATIINSVPAVEISLFQYQVKSLAFANVAVDRTHEIALGAYFARKQGIEAFQKVQRDLQYGKMPGVTIVDGFCILIGGLLLLIPDFLSDIIGGLLPLIPMTRKQIKPLFERWLKTCLIAIAIRLFAKETLN
ncbi:FxsA family protein [Bacillus sp. SL00103]